MTIFELLDSLTEERIDSMENEELDAILILLDIDLEKIINFCWRFPH